MSKSQPRYTILLPLYKETEIIDNLIRAITSLAYPKELLQVLFLLEADDRKTIYALSQKKLPPYCFVLIVPNDGPQTKARACNHGLRYATGEYLVIYDAEDIPEKDQLLKAVQTFETYDTPKLACLQARLTFYNHSENLLTKFCTLEYLLHFNFILPIFSQNEIPIPLGGTSNHFKIAALREVGGWDMYNVTEDADITYRLCRKDYVIKMLDSDTSEETVIDIKSWIRQRSRWIKGHIITFLVQSRTSFPKNQYTNKWKCIFSLYYFMALTSILLFIPLFIMTAIFYAEFLPIKYMLSLNLVLFLYINLIIPLILIRKERKPYLLNACLLYPFYLLLYVLPAYLALFQLIYKPHYWEKTAHGKSSIHEK
jgi:cellulose synthase/poly-beta-1,6-N-acetylglucosamine synthase-like glycosyltransferase